MWKYLIKYKIRNIVKNAKADSIDKVFGLKKKRTPELINSLAIVFKKGTKKSFLPGQLIVKAIEIPEDEAELAFIMYLLGNFVSNNRQYEEYVDTIKDKILINAGRRIKDRNKLN